MTYDAWLEAPYQRRALEAQAEEYAWETLGTDPTDLQPPHNVGDPCPKCGSGVGLALADDETGGVLYCPDCSRDIDATEPVTFDVWAWIEAREDEAAEAKAERLDD